MIVRNLFVTVTAAAAVIGLGGRVFAHHHLPVLLACSMRRCRSLMLALLLASSLDTGSLALACLGEIRIQRNHHISVLQSILLLGVNHLGSDGGSDDRLNLVRVDD